MAHTHLKNWFPRPITMRPFKAPFIKGKVSIGIGALCLASSAAFSQPAHASPRKLIPRMAAIVKYLKAHPLQLSSIPMIYSAEVSVDVPDVAKGLTAQELLGGEAGNTHMASVVLALVAVAFKALDQAHNLVTPLCWGAPTEYGGAPIRNSPAAQEAAYVHALVHRWEGAHDGEFGTGFSNANYWYRATGHHPVMDQLQEQSLKLAGSNTKLQHYVAGPRLDPTRLVNLCSAAVSSQDPEIQAFANKVVNLEWHLLLEWCLDKAAAQLPPRA